MECFICGNGPHEVGSHIFIAVAEAEAFFARQPQGSGAEAHYVAQWRPE